MNIRAQHKYVKVSPKKLRFVAKSIKKLKPVDALSRLHLVQNRSAKMLAKAIKSAVDNGIAVYKISADTLVFAELKIDEGVFLRRMRPGARGMSKPYHRRTSHITVVLESSKKDSNKTKTIEQVKKGEDTQKVVKAQEAKDMKPKVVKTSKTKSKVTTKESK